MGWGFGRHGQGGLIAEVFFLCEDLSQHLLHVLLSIILEFVNLEYRTVAIGRGLFQGQENICPFHTFRLQWENSKIVTDGYGLFGEDKNHVSSAFIQYPVDFWCDAIVELVDEICDEVGREFLRDIYFSLLKLPACDMDSLSFQECCPKPFPSCCIPFKPSSNEGGWLCIP